MEKPKTPSLKIHEVYTSVQGESSHAGRLCTFVRTSGCGLRCTWCDTTQAFYGGTWMSFETLLAKIEELGVSLVEVTGGEPMEQENIHEFLDLLIERGYEVLLETGGHRPLGKVHQDVTRIIDVKCPGSQMAKRNLEENLREPRARDEFKFVLLDRNDFDWAVDKIRSAGLNHRQVLFSPVHGSLDPLELVEWIKTDKLEVRFQIQLHKVLWGAEAEGV